MAPFFLGGGGGAGKHPTVGGGGWGFLRRIWCGQGRGGGVDVVHNQGVWGRGVHGLVMMVHKSLMSDV